MMDLICAGEAMAELRRDGAAYRIGFAGDTFNTAVYAMRNLGPSAQVGFLTRMGNDPMSDELAKLAAKEKVALPGCTRDPERSLGLYAVTTDATGERSFHYWRENSAARRLFCDPMELQILTQAKVAYLSGITLAILSPTAREALYDALETFRSNGGLVAFDSNYRPRLWEDKITAQSHISHMWQMVDIALPSVDDEMDLFDDPDVQTVLTRLRDWGCHKGALKRGPEGPAPLAPDFPSTLSFPCATNVVDTTAAGDSFNGGYLAGVPRGVSETECLKLAHATALTVIAQPGAIVPQRQETA